MDVKRGHLVEAGDMSADITSDGVVYGGGRRVSIQAVWSNGSTPVGNLIVQETNQAGLNGETEATANWVDVAGATLAISGNAGSGIIQITDTASDRFRVFYDRTSGSGDLDIFYKVS